MYVKKTISKLMAVLLSLLMFFSNFSANVFAEENQNGGGIPSDEVEQTPLEKLEELIAQLPTLDEYTSILENNDEEKYEQIATLLEQIEELAEENDIDLTQYDSYMALVGNTEDVDTLTTVTVPWLIGYSYMAEDVLDNGAIVISLYSDITTTLTVSPTVTGGKTTVNSIAFDLNGHTITAPSGQPAIKFASNCSNLAFVLLNSQDNDGTKVAVKGTGNPSSTGLLDLTGVNYFYITNGIIQGRTGTSSTDNQGGTGETAVYCNSAYTSLSIGNGARTTLLVGGDGGSSVNGTGGTGGYGLWTISNNVTIANHARVIGGNGGISISGTGGTGGIGLYQNTGTLKVEDGSSIIGGTGGTSTSGNGGDGGLGISKNSGTTTLATNASVTGGTGGASTEGKGGNGAAAINQTSGTITADATTALKGGNGGDGVTGGKGSASLTGGSTNTINGSNDDGEDGYSVNLIDKDGNETPYETIQEAITNATEDSTIKVLKDITIEEDKPASLPTKVTLDTNGKTVTGTVNISGTDTAIDGAGKIDKVTVNDNASTTIKDGTISELSAGSGSTVTITGGTVSKIEKADDATLIVEGGTFTSDPSSYVDTNEYKVVDNNNGTYSVKPLTVTVTSATELTEALNDSDVKKIIIGKGFDVNSSTSFTVNDTKVIDLNGQTINYTGTGVSSSMISINNPGDLTIIDSSKTDTSEGTGKISATTGRVLALNNSAKFTLEAGTLASTWSDNLSDADTIKVSGTNATINVNGGSITATDRYIIAEPIAVYTTATNTTVNVKDGTFNSNSYDIYVNEGATGTVVNIEGGTFTSENKQAICNIQGIAKLNISGGNFVTTNTTSAIYTPNNAKISGGKYSTNTNLSSCLEDGYIIKNISEGSYKYEVVEDKVVAKIGEAEYESLAEAIAAATDGQTISLNKNITESVTFPADKNITLDLNGKTLTASETPITVSGTLTVTDSSTNSTGKITSDNNEIKAIVVTTGATLNVEDGTITSLNNDLGRVSITGGTFGFDPSEYVDETSFNITNNGDDTYTVTNATKKVTTLNDLNSALSNSSIKKVILDGNITNVTSSIQVSSDTVLDLNGHTLQGTASPLIKINDGKKLTIEDSSESNTGTINSGTGRTVQVGTSASASNGASLVLNEGKITSSSSLDSIQLYGKNSSFTMNGGEVNATGSNTEAIVFESTGDNATVEINGGKISTNGANVIYDGSHKNMTFTVNVNGGEFVTTNNTAISNGTAKVTITDGAFNVGTGGIVTIPSSASITGGKFTAKTDTAVNSLKNALATGYELSPITEDPYNYEVKVSEEYQKADEFKTKYKDILDATTVTKADLDKELGINPALAEYETLDDKVKAFLNAEKEDLDNKKAAATWASNNDAIISATSIDQSSLDKITEQRNAVSTAINQYGPNSTEENVLSDNQKDLVDPQYKELVIKTEALDYLKDKYNIINDEITTKDLSDLNTLKTNINNAKTTYNNISSSGEGSVNETSAKSYVDGGVEGSTTTKLDNKLAAATFLSTDGYSAVLATGLDKLTDVQKNTLESIAEAYDKLDASTKAYIDDSITDKLDSSKAAKSWNDIYADLLASTKTTVTDEDKTKLENAIKAYDALSTDTGAQALIGGDDVKTKLQNMLDAATWYENQKPVITDTDITKDDVDNIQAAIDAYSALKDDAKAYVDDKIVDSSTSAEGKTTYTGDLQDKLDAATFQKDYANQIDSSKKVIFNNDTVADTLDTLNKAVESYEGLNDAEMNYVDKGSKDASGKITSTDYSVLKDKQALAQFLNDNKDILSKETHTEDELAFIKTAYEAVKKTNPGVANYLDANIADIVGADEIAQNFRTKYSDVISKKEVTNDDLTNDSKTGIDDALDAYNELGKKAKEALQTVKDALDDKKAAAEWYKDNESIIEKANIEKVALTDKKSINDAIESLAKLDKDESAYIAESVKYDLNAKKSAVDFLDTNNEVLTVDKINSTNNSDLNKTIKAIDDAINAYKDLNTNAQQYVDGGLKGETSDVLDKLSDQKKAAEFLANSDYNNVLNKDFYTNADLTDLNKALKEFDNLTESQKELLPEKINELMNDVKQANTWITESAGINNTNDKISSSNLKEITDALDKTDKYSETTKQLLDSYIDSLKDKKAAAEWSKDADSAINASAPLEDTDIKNVKDAADKLSDLEKTNKNAYNYLDPAVTSDIKKKDEAADLLEKYGYKTTYDATTGVTTESGIIGKQTVTAKDEPTIEAAIKELLDMEKADKTDNSAYNYAGGDNLKQDLYNQKSAADFQDKYKDVLNKSIDTLTDDDFETLKKANEELNSKNQDGSDVYPADVKKYIGDDIKDLLSNADEIKSYKDSNSEILSKDTVTDNDSSLIDKALDEAKKLSDKAKTALKKLIDSLKSKKKVSNWFNKNKDIINKNSAISKDDKNAIDNALSGTTTDADNNPSTLDDTDKKHIPDGVLDDLNTKKEIVDYLDTNTYKTGTDESGNPTESGIIGKKPITSSDKDSIYKAIDDYNKISNKLTDENKNLLDTNVLNILEEEKKAVDYLTDDSYSNQFNDTNVANKRESDLDALKKADEAYKKLDDSAKELLPDDVKNLITSVEKVTSWQEKNKAINDKQYVDGNDSSAIDEALSMKYGNGDETLSEDEQKLIDSTKKALEDKKQVSDFYNNNANALTDNNVSAGDTSIDDAYNAYNNLTEEQKKYVSPTTTKKLTSKKKAADWLNNNNDLINKEGITQEDTSSLKDALDAYNDLDGYTKSFIPSTTVDKLIDDIKTASPATKNFIDNYLDDVNNITKDNYQKILSSKDAYNALDEETKSLVEAILKAETGKSYEELYSEAQKMKDDIDKASKTANTSDTTNIATPIIIFPFALLSALLLFFYRRKQSSN